MAVFCRDQRHGIDDDKRDVAYALNLFFQSTHVPRRIKPSRSIVLAGAPHEMHPPKIRTCGYQSRNERVGGIVLARPDDDARLFRPHAIRPHAAGRDNRGELERQRRLSGSRLTTKEVEPPARQPSGPEPFYRLRNNARRALKLHSCGVVRRSSGRGCLHRRRREAHLPRSFDQMGKIIFIGLVE